MNQTNSIELDLGLSIQECLEVVYQHKKLVLSQNYKARIQKGNQIIQDWNASGTPVYGVNTGFGAFCNHAIAKDQMQQLQTNIIRSHAISVGETMPKHVVRAMMLMILVNVASGQTGIRVAVMQRYCDALNHDWIPSIPKDGSVGYLNPEAFLAAALLLGEGNFLVEGKEAAAEAFFAEHAISKIAPEAKEGLILISSTTSVCAYALLGLSTLQKCFDEADKIASFSLQILRGKTGFLQAAIHQAKPHPTQISSAKCMLSFLEGYSAPDVVRLQEPLSSRSIPQVHGAVKQVVNDALSVLSVEINACCDNPLIDFKSNQALSNANPDATFVGLECDSAALAATVMAKMVERRSANLLEKKWTGLNDFLAFSEGLESGMMIAQYTQAGLLNQMRTLSTSASIDTAITSSGQEDYVNMGYNAAQKLYQISEKLAYILSIEALLNLQAYRLAMRQKGSGSLYTFSAAFDAFYLTHQFMLPEHLGDHYFTPTIEKLKATFVTPDFSDTKQKKTAVCSQ